MLFIFVYFPSYLHLLESFKTNQTDTNNYIVRYLHKIATDKNIAPMLYSVDFFIFVS